MWLFINHEASIIQQRTMLDIVRHFPVSIRIMLIFPASKRSLWHMLGGSLETLQAMVDDTSSEFDPEDGGAGKGHSGVWFDRKFHILFRS